MMNDEELKAVLKEYDFTLEDYESVIDGFMNPKRIYNERRSACLYHDGDSGMAIISLSELFDIGLMIRNIDCSWSDIPISYMAAIYAELVKGDIESLCGAGADDNV